MLLHFSLKRSFVSRLNINLENRKLIISHQFSHFLIWRVNKLRLCEPRRLHETELSKEIVDHFFIIKLFDLQFL